MLPLSHPTARLDHTVFTTHLLKDFEVFTHLHLCTVVNTGWETPLAELLESTPVLSCARCSLAPGLTH